jgi:hypothetical protein
VAPALFGVVSGYLAQRAVARVRRYDGVSEECETIVPYGTWINESAGSWFLATAVFEQQHVGGAATRLWP